MTHNDLSFLMFMLFTKYKYLLERRLSLATKDHGARLTWKYTCWNPFVEGHWLDNHLKVTRETPRLPRATKISASFRIGHIS